MWPSHPSPVSICNEKKFDEAKAWYEKLIAVKPNNKEAYYTLGVIAWTKWYPVLMAARAKLGMKPEDPGPLKDKKVKEELKAPVAARDQRRAGQPAKGARDRQRIRRRHGVHEPPDSRKGRPGRRLRAVQKDMQVADDWVQKALQTKKIKAERKPTGGGIVAEPAK